MTASKEDLLEAKAELKRMTPEPMNTMLEKESKESAIQKRTYRKNIVVEDVPPTCQGMLKTDVIAIEFDELC